MTDLEVLAALDDRRVLALTAWAEARQVPRGIPSEHSPVEELIAVMVVCRNRRGHFGRWRAADASYKAICLAPAQFSCWNAGSGSNHAALMVLARQLVDPIDIANSPVPVVEETDHGVATVPTLDPLVRECLYLADGVIAGTLLDRTGAATSYYAPAAMIPPGRVPIAALSRPRLLIGDQYFYIV